MLVTELLWPMLKQFQCTHGAKATFHPRESPGNIRNSGQLRGEKECFIISSLIYSHNREINFAEKAELHKNYV